MLSKEVLVFGLYFLCILLNERVHSWLTAQDSVSSRPTCLVDGRPDSRWDGENERTDLSIHIPTDCSNQEEVNSLSPTTVRPVLLFVVLVLVSYIPPTKAEEEDLEQLVACDF